MTPQQRLLSLTSKKSLGTGNVWALLLIGAGALIGLGWWLAKKTGEAA